MRLKWSDDHRCKVAEDLQLGYPQLSIDKLLAALRACEHDVEFYERVRRESYLITQRGTAEAESKLGS
jgi:hypothetical protein